MKPNVCVLARTKNRRVWSAYLERKMNALYHDTLRAHRCTHKAAPRFKPERFKAVLNYGCSFRHDWMLRLPDDVLWLNTPEQVKISANKIKTFEALEYYEIPHLPYHTTRDAAQARQLDGVTMVARTMLTGSRGAGIVVVKPDQRLPEASLYTELMRRKGLREYRVWFVGDTVIDVACKKRWRKARLAAAGIDPADRMKQLVRTHGNGWVFARKLPTWTRDWAGFKDMVAQVVEAGILYWGCVDALVDSETGDWWVIEVNSAPGMKDKRTRFALRDALFSTINDRVKGEVNG